MKSNYLIYFFLVPLFVTGCAAVRPVTDMAAARPNRQISFDAKPRQTPAWRKDMSEVCFVETI